MGRSLEEVLAELPPKRREQIHARYLELREEVEGLRELRRIAGKAQADVATALKIKQPSVSKIEKQTDMYLSTLRDYVEAIGGELELTVKLPKRPAFKIRDLGAIAIAEPSASPSFPVTPAKAGGKRERRKEPVAQASRAPARRRRST